MLKRTPVPTALAALLLSAAALLPAQAQEPKVLNYARTGQFESLDPPRQFDSESHDVISMVYSTLLRYAYISFFCLLAGLATLHLVWIILTNRCAVECPELFGMDRRPRAA